jgi:hypothetical protein
MNEAIDFALECDRIFHKTYNDWWKCDKEEDADEHVDNIIGGWQRIVDLCELAEQELDEEDPSLAKILEYKSLANERIKSWEKPLGDWKKSATV